MKDIRIENFLHPYVRFFNAQYNNGNVDFYLGNAVLAANIGFGKFSPYIKVQKGRHDFYITPAGNKSKRLASATIDFSDGEVYTVAAVKDSGGVLAYGINEPVKRFEQSYGHIRICQLIPDAGTVDIYANKYEILGEINYLEISKYICIAPGRYDFLVKRSGSDETILNVSSQVMREGVYNTLYLIGNAAGKPNISGILSVDAASYTGYYL